MCLLAVPNWNISSAIGSSDISMWHKCLVAQLWKCVVSRQSDILRTGVSRPSPRVFRPHRQKTLSTRTVGSQKKVLFTMWDRPPGWIGLSRTGSGNLWLRSSWDLCHVTDICSLAVHGLQKYPHSHSLVCAVAFKAEQNILSRGHQNKPDILLISTKYTPDILQCLVQPARSIGNYSQGAFGESLCFLLNFKWICEEIYRLQKFKW